MLEFTPEERTALNTRVQEYLSTELGVELGRFDVLL
jgi:uncharacterized protein (DUF2164 family)